MHLIRDPRLPEDSKDHFSTWTQYIPARLFNLDYRLRSCRGWYSLSGVHSESPHNRPPTCIRSSCSPVLLWGVLHVHLWIVGAHSPRLRPTCGEAPCIQLRRCLPW
ncbi:hypothetical protein B0H10DRAFT_2195088, partial [Mycena sp. CBHHK59/15]